MEKAKRKSVGVSRTRSIAFVALSIALLAVSAWISVPFGPVPFTLQTFVVVFAFLVLTPVECVVAIAGYLLLGAIGLPMFASMRGGIGVLAGTTGGFLWGFLLGAALAILVRFALKALLARREGAEGTTSHTVLSMVIDFVAGFVFLGITYVCGWAQLMAVAMLTPEAAFIAGVAPFIIIDIIKLIAAVLCARAVVAALPKR